MLRYGMCGVEVIDPQPSCRLKESAKMANEASRSAQPSCGCVGGRTSLCRWKDVPHPGGWVDFVVVIAVPHHLLFQPALERRI